MLDPPPLLRKPVFRWTGPTSRRHGLSCHTAWPVHPCDEPLVVSSIHCPGPGCAARVLADLMAQATVPPPMPRLPDILLAQGTAPPPPGPSRPDKRAAPDDALGTYRDHPISLASTQFLTDNVHARVAADAAKRSCTRESASPAQTGIDLPRSPHLVAMATPGVASASGCLVPRVLAL